MYIHAYQSYVWNAIVSERIRTYGSDHPVVGDLVFDKPEDAKKMDVDMVDDESLAVEAEPSKFRPPHMNVSSLNKRSRTFVKRRQKNPQTVRPSPCPHLDGGRPRQIFDFRCYHASAWYRCGIPRR